MYLRAWRKGEIKMKYMEEKLSLQREKENIVF